MIGDVQLIDDGAVAGEQRDATIQSSSSMRWLLGVGALIVAVIGWSILASSSPTDELADGAEVDAEQSTTTTEAPATTTTQADTASTRRTTTTTSPVGVVGEGGPLLGEAVGYDLLIGRFGKRPSRLDLDTGEIQHHDEGGSFNPLMVSGDFVVGRVNDSIAALPLDELGAESASISGGTYYELASWTSRPDGRALFISYGGSYPSLQLVDLATFETVENYEQPEGAQSAYWGPFSAQSEPELITVAGAGVYERTADGGFQLRVSGRMLVGDSARVLIERCDERLQCERVWLDRQTWGEVDLEIPDGLFEGARMVNDTNWMLYFESDQWIPRLFNVADGRTHPVDREVDFWSQGVAISPDGRWYAHTRAGDLIITDLQNGDDVVIDEDLRVTGALVFVEHETN